MFEHKKIQSLEDYFLPKSGRPGGGTYFYRIDGYSDQIEKFLMKYYETAHRMGVVIEGRIPNPDEKNLSYYDEIMGMDFRFSSDFIVSSLKKWLPRTTPSQRSDVASALFDTLETMRRQGKNENMLRNAYIKYMCWLYYKFERVVNQLGQENLPKILYEGEISSHELNFLSILSKSGCDIVMLQSAGDGGYQKLDASSILSCRLELPGMEPFPDGFCLKSLRQEAERRSRNAAVLGGKPDRQRCTNAWIKGEGLNDILTPVRLRGSDKNLFYNCFIRINGVEDKLTYLNELYGVQSELRSGKRCLEIVENGIPKPAPEEIAAVKRKNYADSAQMTADLMKNIIFTDSIELQKIMRSAFADTILEEEKQAGMNLNRLTNRAVYLLCWLKRYQSNLFRGFSGQEIGCFIFLGGCRDEHEAAFVRYLAKLPTDVLILVPDLNRKCCLKDSVLYEMNFDASLSVEKFPRADGDVRMATAAYQAERELDTVLYQDSGMYRNQQYHKAVSLTLQSIYEEIWLLWNEELRFRPNFSTVGDTVNMPVIFSKVSGVKNGAVSEYWADIRKLMTEDCFVIQGAPFIRPEDANPVRAYASQFFRNGKIQKAKIKAHACYKYGFLREEIQDYILEKVQLLIDQKLIRGTFENGTEYTIVATALNLHKNIVRLIQKFDFTKKNPKLIYINTTENIISLEDSILTALLSLVGFDIVFFVPTGYQCVEKHFSRKWMVEHQIGEYIYDLRIPDFSSMSSDGQRSWRERLFSRGK